MKHTIEFKCPMCGGRKYGTSPNFALRASATTDDVDAIGVCSQQGCGYEWPRIEDFRVFIEVRRFETQEQFEAAGGWAVRGTRL